MKERESETWKKGGRGGDRIRKGWAYGDRQTKQKTDRNITLRS